MGFLDPGAIGRSVVTACLVAGPLAVGIGVGHDAAGATATLGAYLWTVGHLTVGRPIGIRVAAVASVLLGVAGVTGALAGGRLWLLVVLAVVWATCQAVAEIAATALRMPVAMSALCFLLSAIGGAVSPRAALWRGLLVLVGAAWASLCELARNPPWRSPGEGSRNIGLAGSSPLPRLCPAVVGADRPQRRHRRAFQDLPRRVDGHDGAPCRAA